MLHFLFKYSWVWLTNLMFSSFFCALTLHHQFLLLHIEFFYFCLLFICPLSISHCFRLKKCDYYTPHSSTNCKLAIVDSRRFYTYTILLCCVNLPTNQTEDDVCWKNIHEWNEKRSKAECVQFFLKFITASHVELLPVLPFLF